MTVATHLLHAALAVVAWWLCKVVQVIHSTRGQPGFVAVLRPYSEFGQVFFPYHWRFNLGIGLAWKLKTDLYRKYNSNILVVPSLFPPVVTILVADAQAIHQVNNDHQHFQKDPISTGSVGKLFGSSILTSEGAEWRRHRKVVVSGFSERNTAALWDSTIDVVSRWIEENKARAGQGESILVRNTENVWAILALLIMGQAGFGIDLGWPASLASGDGLDHSSDSSANAFYSASSRIVKDWIPLAFLPKIFLRPIPITADFKKAVEGQALFEKELGKAVSQRVEEVKAEGKGQDEKKNDLLTLLCRANVLEDTKSKLSAKELFSDAFVFLIAGHETTAGTITAALAFLSIYPQYQTAILEEVSSVFGDGTNTSYPATYRALPMTLAVVHETLRLAGPAQALHKASIAPTALLAKKVAPDGSTSEGDFVFVPQGAYVRIHVQGVHYSDDWTDATSFKPERFLEKENINERMKSLLPFSSGSRGCIGRQFSLVESVALIAMIVHKYKLEVPPHKKEEWAKKEGESENEWHDRVLSPLNFFTLAPQNVDLVFVPRD
ncbi:hypothetical protein JCM11491_005652 [Sporobolomyces phaffii]